MSHQPQFLKVTVGFFSHGAGSTILAERLGLSTPSSPTSTPNSPTVLCSGVSDPILSTCGSGPLCSSISGKRGGIPPSSFPLPPSACSRAASLHDLRLVSQKDSKTTMINSLLSAPLGRKGEPLQRLFSVCFTWKLLRCLDSNISPTLFIMKSPKGRSRVSVMCVAL